MADVEEVSSPKFVVSQKGKRLLHYRKHLFNLNKTRKYAETTKLLWQCERRRAAQCSVYVTTDENGAILKDSTVDHNHSVPSGRAEGLVVKNNLLTEAERRPDVAPAGLLDEFVTSGFPFALVNKKQLKQAVQYRRKKFRPNVRQTTREVVINEPFNRNLDGVQGYLGHTTLKEEVAHIFATEDNFRILSSFTTSMQALSPVLTINVGGTLFTTLRSTLCKYEDSMLASMFSGRHEVATDSEGRPFLDADPSYFEHILRFLRREILPILPSFTPTSNKHQDKALTSHETWEMYREALYFGIEPLANHLRNHPIIFNRLVRQTFDEQFPLFQKGRSEILEAAMQKMSYVKGFATLVVHKCNAYDLSVERGADCDADVFLSSLKNDEERGYNHLTIVNDLRKDGFNITCSRGTDEHPMCGHEEVDLKFSLKSESV